MRSVVVRYLLISTIALFLIVFLSFYVLLGHTKKNLERSLRRELERSGSFVEESLSYKLKEIERLQRFFVKLAQAGLWEQLKGQFLWEDDILRFYFKKKGSVVSLEKMEIPPEKMPHSGCTVKLIKGKFALMCGGLTSVTAGFSACWDIMEVFSDILMMSSVRDIYVVVTSKKGKILFSTKLKEIALPFKVDTLKDFITYSTTAKVPLIGEVRIYASKSKASFYSDISRWEKTYFLTLAVCIALIAFLMLFFRRKVVEQVQPIIEAIKGLSQEDYTVRVKNVGKLKGEFRYIAETLNRMGERILQHYMRVAQHMEIFRNLNESVILTDQRGIINYVNRPTEGLFGYRREELIGTSIYNLYKGSIPVKLGKEPVKQPIVVEEVEMLRKDGSTIICRQTISPVRTDEGIRSYVFLTVDLTEKMKLLKELEEKTKELERKNEELQSLNDELQIQAEELEANSEELRVLNEELEEKTRELEAALKDLQKALDEKERLYKQLMRDEKMRILGLMASGLAHNFNNILTVILGNVELLETVVEDEEIRRRLARIRKAAEDGINTIKRLSDFARFREKPVKELVDIREIIDDAFELTRPIWMNRMKKKGVEVVVEKDYCEEPALIKGNPSELKELFVNLITNAVDAMPYGGKIRVMVTKERDYVLVDFTDTGVGIPEDVKDKIFDPFFTTKASHGTGLGLSMVYWTVENHGGTIEVYSEEGKGTTFSIKFPAA